VNKPRVLDLIEASHSRAGDVKAALASVDAQSATVDGGQSVELRFAGGPIAEGMVRDWFLVAKGSCDVPYRQAEARTDQPVASAGAPQFAMGSAVPNPTRGLTSIHYSLGSTGPVSIGIFDVAGRRVRGFDTPNLAAGPAVQDWDGRDDRGTEVAGGVYFVRIRAQGWSGETKVILLRK
jgi:hypothetical protein